MGLVPTVESIIRDLGQADGCVVTLRNGNVIGGTGLPHFAAHALQRLQAENEDLRRHLEYWLPKDLPFTDQPNDAICQEHNTRWQNARYTLDAAKQGASDGQR